MLGDLLVSSFIHANSRLFAASYPRLGLKYFCIRRSHPPPHLRFHHTLRSL
jgi:hypothetical protein